MTVASSPAAPYRSPLRERDRAPQLLLAPMEGLLDFVLRDVLTRVGGADRCVSEFIRVTGHLLPDHVFYRFMPELLHGSRTLAGVPVRAQLLGSDAACMAENAAFVAELGAEGVDLNFGCPAKVVNRHGGGAALLQDPECVHRIVQAVRAAVPAHLPVSAKMRLGFEDDSLSRECAQAIEAGGACELVVHARTKADGYRPPAYWERLPALCEAVDLPVVANGEVWTLEDALRCRERSGCRDLMLGRGIVADPGLAWAIRAHDAGSSQTPVPAQTWADVVPHLARFWSLVLSCMPPRQCAGRLKQWLNLLRRRFPEAEAAFETVRVMTDSRTITAWVEAHAGPVETVDLWGDETLARSLACL